jgi:hypothetical protein
MRKEKKNQKNDLRPSKLHEQLSRIQLSISLLQGERERLDRAKVKARSEGR